ncbi:hypothetical protein [Pseudoramibacter faecis]|uniref:hypothetical protein n=1 Tax=Pseudoramibacter faecis TaxID=3108534 RepID=UPI002E7AAA99|nr:hypothetical protein [Pseudoramibacter sp. HA2172]
MRLGNLGSTRFLAAAICSAMGAGGAANSPASPAEQKVQPPVPRAPSRLGQLQPALSESLWTLVSKRALSASEKKAGAWGPHDVVLLTPL